MKDERVVQQMQLGSQEMESLFPENNLKSHDDNTSDPGSNPCPSFLDRFLPKAYHLSNRTFPGNPSIDR